MTLEPTSRPRGTANRILVGVWTLALLPVTGFLLLISGFAVSPTQCPETGGSYLCSGVAVVGAFLAAMAAGSSWS